VSRSASVFSPDALVEERIQEALRRGDFDRHPGERRGPGTPDWIPAFAGMTMRCI
jgi:hypothetical protein